MTKTILCAVDINRPKAEAKVLEQAFKLAQVEDAQLDVITVVPDFGMSVVGAFFDESHAQKAKDKAHALLSEMVENTIGAEANEKVRHIIGVGKAYHVILTTADADGADLIVLGAHKPEVSDYLLGPNAARVVRHSTCSVYVVRG
ncbi:Nucleotide-binding universal stress protein, UspA family [Aliiroseovarius halocynthiae]|uniref:Universal stress protein n=1 Tax=Aliiroseovarius halocynthiae TaxID=985055 RepID=A0A545SU70_9RHOB|nr:universal stress protein [Aliiroseovarius halocynthiae]TQV68513.1 universal stress protein [Aliiroseovarius halocynthiae]SMR70913.1 Nucleotide-binding universal stress protein, UspA family [Aliiroseovarius halocynthiae]